MSQHLVYHQTSAQQHAQLAIQLLHVSLVRPSVPCGRIVIRIWTYSWQNFPLNLVKYAKLSTLLCLVLMLRLHSSHINQS